MTGKMSLFYEVLAQYEHTVAVTVRSIFKMANVVYILARAESLFA